MGWQELVVYVGGASMILGFFFRYIYNPIHKILDIQEANTRELNRINSKMKINKEQIDCNKLHLEKDLKHFDSVEDEISDINKEMKIIKVDNGVKFKALEQGMSLSLERSLYTSPEDIEIINRKIRDYLVLPKF